MGAALAQLRGCGEVAQLVAVVDAFDVPKISYDPVGRKMFADSRPRRLFAGAEVRGLRHARRASGAGQRAAAAVARVHAHSAAPLRACQCMHACPQAKHQLYVDRLQLIGQRLRRNEKLQQNNRLMPGCTGDKKIAQVRGSTGTPGMHVRRCRALLRALQGTRACAKRPAPPAMPACAADGPAVLAWGGGRAAHRHGVHPEG